MQSIGILGAGAWGTALAMASARAGLRVTLQAHEPGVAETLDATRENSAYLPGIVLDHAVRVTASIEETVRSDAVLLVVPTQFLRPVLVTARASWKAGTPAVICAKGIEQGTLKLLSAVVAETLGNLAPVAVLSGPTFASEVAREMPTAVTLACADEPLGQRLCEALSSRHFRPYACTDVIGAQVGGAVKNVLAIACGIVQGKNLGDNGRAALITRGLAEIARLGVVLGADEHTLMGLSGLGDLTLTCNAMQSRNFSLGVAMGQGRKLDDILGERTSVAEGVYTAAAVTELAARLNVEMPICQAVNAVLNGGADLDTVIFGLLNRPLNVE